MKFQQNNKQTHEINPTKIQLTCTYYLAHVNNNRTAYKCLTVCAPFEWCPSEKIE